jgi:Spy/CpxP family protein refolding chaperone
MKKVVILLSLLVLSGLPFSVIAQEGSPGNQAPIPGERPCVKMFPGPGPHPAGPFNLTKEQRDKMMELDRRFMAETHDLRFDILIKRLEVEKLFTNPKTSETALLNKQKELSSLEQGLATAEAKKRIEWRRLLTAEQIAQLGSLPPPAHPGFGAPGPMMDGSGPAGGKGPGGPPGPRDFGPKD